MKIDTKWLVNEFDKWLKEQPANTGFSGEDFKINEVKKNGKN